MLRSSLRFRPSLSFLLLGLFLVVLWVAGGASRGDVAGQALVRGAAWAVLAVLILFGRRPTIGDAWPVVSMVVAAIAIVAVQLIPLPPALWQALPGRAVFEQAATLSGQPQPWRPLAIVPGATMNSLASLVVPAAVLILLLGLRKDERSWMPGVLLALVVAAALFGLLQTSGAQVQNPFVNDTPGEVSGPFANRNHFALFVAFGCLLAPAWAFMGGRATRWRRPLVFVLVPLLALLVLATGSRAGIALAGIALALGAAMIWRELQRVLRRYPRWVFPAAVGAIVVAVAAIVLVSVLAGRAPSIERIITMDPSQDLRRRGLPTVLAMIWAYFPVGIGAGGFDPLFRLHEPFAMLGPTYFNHAHDDLVEVILEAGLLGAILLLTAIIWWAVGAYRVWRAPPDPRDPMPRLGGAMLLLVLVASVFDYPVRTPLMMAMVVIAAFWLCEASARGRSDFTPQ